MQKQSQPSKHFQRGRNLDICHMCRAICQTSQKWNWNAATVTPEMVGLSLNVLETNWVAIEISTNRVSIPVPKLKKLGNSVASWVPARSGKNCNGRISIPAEATTLVELNAVFDNPKLRSPTSFTRLISNSMPVCKAVGSITYWSPSSRVVVAE